jgi:hypothetical protein
MMLDRPYSLSRIGVFEFKSDTVRARPFRDRNNLCVIRESGSVRVRHSSESFESYLVQNLFSLLKCELKAAVSILRNLCQSVVQEYAAEVHSMWMCGHSPIPRFRFRKLKRSAPSDFRSPFLRSRPLVKGTGRENCGALQCDG